MELDSFRLVALIPPGSVQAEVGKLQAAIFSRFGAASSQALPPLIPIQFIGDAGSPRALLDQLDGSVGAPWRVTTRRFSWMQGHLFLEVDSGGTWSTLAAGTRSWCAAEPDVLFPQAEGFYLGCGEATPAQRDAMQGDTIIAEAPSASFSSCVVAVLGIRTPRGREQWWREVYWEMLEQRPLRGRRVS
jgi:hypothetical protein